MNRIEKAFTMVLFLLHLFSSSLHNLMNKLNRQITYVIQEASRDARRYYRHASSSFGLEETSLDFNPS